MKQHITEKQLKELKGNSKRKLNAWWKKHYEGEDIPGSIDGEGYDCGSYFLPLLSIGQMIEFLDEHQEYPECLIEDYYGSEEPCEQTYCGAEFYDTDKLCDALWEAVKKALNE